MHEKVGKLYRVSVGGLVGERIANLPVPDNVYGTNFVPIPFKALVTIVKYKVESINRYNPLDVIERYELLVVIKGCPMKLSVGLGPAPHDNIRSNEVFEEVKL